jgi:hypothetical protein
MKTALFAICVMVLAGGASAQTVAAPTLARPAQAPVVTTAPATAQDPRESRGGRDASQRAEQLRRARLCEENARLDAQRAEAAQRQSQAMDAAVINMQLGIVSAAPRIAASSQSVTAPTSAAPVTAPPRVGVAAPAAATTAQPAAQPPCTAP